MRVIVRFVFIMTLFYLTAPASAIADLRQFIPRIYNTEGDLEVNASHENKENLSAGKGFKTSDTFLSEKVVLTFNGFVYHPRFLLFLGKLGGGLSQEKYNRSSAAISEDSENNAFVWEYEFRTLLLPEHPYNLELFVMRYNPFIVGRANPELSSVTNSEGALFTYKKRPFKFKLNYNISDTESSRSESSSEHLGGFANYFKEKFSLAGSAAQSVTKHSSGSGESEFKLINYSIQNQIRLFQRKVYLTSSANQILSNQQSVTTVTEGNRLTWSEQLNMYLPWNFNTIITYGYFRDVQRLRDIDTEAKGKTESMTNTAGLSVTHQLYESLKTAYNFNYNASLTSTGDSFMTMNNISAAYTKKIPWGKLFAGLQLSESRLDRRGLPSVTGESYTAAIFGEFTLVEKDIDEESIIVYVKDPVSGAPIELTLDIHYTITLVGNTYSVFIKDIPDDYKDPDPFYEYNFRVTYSFDVGSFEIRKSAYGYNLKLELFDSLASPYYTYYHEQQEVLSGTLPGGPDELTAQTVGLVLEKRPYSLLMEYQDFDSRLNASKRYRAETNYRQHFNAKTYLDARLYYREVKHLASASNPESTTATTTGIDLKINQRYPRRNLVVTAFGSYSNSKQTYKTNTYILGAAVTWKVAKIDLSLGANISRRESALDTGKTETTSQTYYLKLKRQLF